MIARCATISNVFLFSTGFVFFVRTFILWIMDFQATCVQPWYLWKICHLRYYGHHDGQENITYLIFYLLEMLPYALPNASSNRCTFPISTWIHMLVTVMWWSTGRHHMKRHIDFMSDWENDVEKGGVGVGGWIDRFVEEHRRGGRLVVWGGVWETSKRLNLKWKIERKTNGRTLIRTGRQKKESRTEWVIVGEGWRGGAWVRGLFYCFTDELSTFDRVCSSSVEGGSLRQPPTTIKLQNTLKHTSL